MDRFSPAARSAIMRGNKSKDTRPELTVRRLTHSLGYRYRLHSCGLPSKPDLVFPGRRKVIFVHGCFWHQHVSAHCPIVQYPKSNTEYWTEKLQRNIERDKENVIKLEEMGWRSIII